MERSPLNSIVTCKCPRCRQGDVFVHQNPYHPKFGDIHESCDHCGLVYEMEQGFWYGAMYVSYAMGVALAIPLILILSFTTELEIYQMTIAVFVLLVVTMPLLFRYSRSMWLHIFIRYDRKLVEKLKKQS